MERLSRAKTFGGWTETYVHRSAVCGGEMRFGVFLPPQVQTQKVPVVTFLSGLTCTEENFLTKAGAQRWAADLGLMLVAPDTSPRKTGYPGATDAWDFGEGAGFYVNATEKPWSERFRMFDYVNEELRDLVLKTFPVAAGRESIMGHSMGGHGALVSALRHPGRYRCVSAFAPISHPTRCPWGQKAFRNYLGANESRWADWDATLLVERGAKPFPLLVDQGTDDKFLKEQLMPEALEAACKAQGFQATFRQQTGYDHGYYFIQSFMGDHLRFHKEWLSA